MKRPRKKHPLSARKRAAILANLAKARAVKRTRSSYERSRHNALKHGMFVRSPERLLEDLGKGTEEFRQLHRLVRRAFVPKDRSERVIVRRLTEALWRRLNMFHALARWEQDALEKQCAALPASRPLSPENTLERAYLLLYVFSDQVRFWGRMKLVTGEVERLARLLVRRRGGLPRRQLGETRRSSAELAELSPDPADWQRRYAAAVPLPKTVRELKRPSAEVSQKSRDESAAIGVDGSEFGIPDEGLT